MHICVLFRGLTDRLVCDLSSTMSKKRISHLVVPRLSKTYSRVEVLKAITEAVHDLGYTSPTSCKVAVTERNRVD